MTAAVGVAGWTLTALALVAALVAEMRHLAWRERVARAAHELRGPITAAQLGLRLSARTDDRSSGRLRAIEFELERAAMALDDLGSARAVRQQRNQLGEVDLAALLRDCVEALTPAAKGHGAELELRLPAVLPAVHGDRLRLAQAVDNLISNAVEHGGGLIEVAARIHGPCIRVEVTDGGPGLPATVADLCRRARRGRGSRGRGLAIAAAIAADHGGRLACGPSDRGARLLLELPLPTVSRAGEPHQAPAPEPAG